MSRVIRGAGGQANAADTCAVARVLEGKLSGIPQPLQQEDFNALKEILELLEMEDSPKPSGVRREEAAEDSEDDSPSPASDSGSDEREVGRSRASIETRLERLCSYIDEDWETVIENYFTGFNYCIKSFSRYVCRNCVRLAPASPGSMQP